MPVISREEVARYAREAGLPEASIPMAVAVAELESSRNTDAKGDRNNPKQGCSSVGLWQINSCPSRDSSGHPRYGNDPDALKDPAVNARSMVTISNGGTNWGPWSTMARAKLLVVSQGGSMVGQAPGLPGELPAPPDPTTPATGVPVDLAAGSTWGRVGSAIGGVALCAAAYWIIKADMATGGLI